MRRRSSHLIALSFACHLVRIVCRSTVNLPDRVVAQICVNPRKLKVSGFPSPRRDRSRIAWCPNSISRVFSGCSSRLSRRKRARRSSRGIGQTSPRVWVEVGSVGQRRRRGWVGEPRRALPKGSRVAPGVGRVRPGGGAHRVPPWTRPGWTASKVSVVATSRRRARAERELERGAAARWGG